MAKIPLPLLSHPQQKTATKQQQQESMSKMMGWNGRILLYSTKKATASAILPRETQEGFRTRAIMILYLGSPKRPRLRSA